MRSTLLLISIVFISLNVFAQAPQKMSYQTVVRDGGDVILGNQLIGMQISILQGTPAGTAVYVETQTPTTNVNGLASIEIGGGSLVSGDFSTIDWASGSYFIKTEIDPTGGTAYTITGTSQLLSVPYALHAKTAENVTGYPSFLLAAPNQDTALLTPFETIEMDVTLASSGTNITRNNGEITLAPGHIYRCSGTVHVTMSASNTWTRFMWYDNTATTWIGVPGTLVTDNRNFNEGQAPRAIAYFDLSTEINNHVIRLRHYQNALYNVVWGASNQTYCECMQLD